jgi:predicted TIM-barrel fold metal-dependent hydrolase
MNERIISADSHVAITEAAVLAHLARKHHDAYREARSEEAAQLARRGSKAAGGASTAGRAPNEQATWEAAGRPGEYDPLERLKDMDLDGVEAEVLYSDIHAGQALYGLPSDARLEAFRAFNDAALAFASHAPKRLLPVYLLPVVEVEQAIAELQRLAAQGARALMIPLYPTDAGLPAYYDRSYDRLWSAIQETGIAISQHVGGNEYLFAVMERDPTPAKGIFQTIPPLHMCEPITSWIVSGTLERFPGLKIVFVETGLGWLPFMLDRLDGMCQRHGWLQVGMLKEKPSFYWHRQLAFTFEEDEFGVAHRHRLGVDNLMWATDYPHPDSTWPHSQQVIETHFRDVPVDEARRIIGGNAARIYRL